MRRSVESEIRQWLRKDKAKPLILRGARQVGKSFLARKIGAESKIYIELNLEKGRDAAHFSDSVLSAKEVFESILLSANKPYKLEETLLFIDEIQEVPAAIQMLRYFYEELPELHVIAAGSLLEFAYSEIESFPVGRVEQLMIRPMTFEEFLGACGEEKALEYYRQIPTPKIADTVLFDLFNSYMEVGGMPEAVKSYIENGKTIIGISKIYSSIWDTYQSDVEKYAKNATERKIIRHITNNLGPVGERISFAGYGNSDYGSKSVSEAFSDLQQAGLFRLIYPTTDTKPPLNTNQKRKPRLQFLDTGILAHSLGLTKSVYLKKERNAASRGRMLEHIMHQELLAINNELSWQPRFWVREKANSSAEVDAVIDLEGRAYPIEAKSGKKGSLKSLSEYMDRCDHDISFRILDNSFAVEETETRLGKKFRLFNIPFYSIGRIESWIEYAESL
jgi:predicted AAA+ superfamily ATPase